MERAEILIDKFFIKGLNSDEQQELETLLKNNPLLNEQFEFEKNLQTAVQEKEFDRLTAKMDELETEIVSETQKKTTELTPKGKTRVLFPKWMRVAAVFVGLLTLGYFTFDAIMPENTIQLADNYYESFPNISYNIKRGQSIKSKEALAFTAYEEKDFKNAEKYFSSIKEEDRKDFIWFYLANSQFELGKYQQAIDNYKTSIQKQAFVSESYWYSALTHLKMKDKNKAKTALKTLIDKHNYKQAEAKELLRKIK